MDPSGDFDQKFYDDLLDDTEESIFLSTKVSRLSSSESGYVSPASNASFDFFQPQEDADIYPYRENNRLAVKKLDGVFPNGFLYSLATELAQVQLAVLCKGNNHSTLGMKKNGYGTLQGGSKHVKSDVVVAEVDLKIKKKVAVVDLGCNFCRQVESYTCAKRGIVFNEEADSHWKHHQLKDIFGNVTCPYLFAYVCPICGATKEKAHTVRYCPVNYARKFSTTLR